MDKFLKEYKKMCKEEFGIYGFKAYRNNHYRVVNDIYQSFNLHLFSSGTECTVEFCIVPLCLEYDIDRTFVNPCNLKNFIGKSEWFNYDRNSLLSIRMCIDEMFLYMHKYLIPLFEKAVDCKSAYSMMCEFSHVFAGNSYEKFCMCLKCKDYENAKIHIKEVVEQSEKAFQINKDAYGENISEDYVIRMNERISEEKKMLKMIEDKNYVFLRKWLLNNEKRNIYNLKWNL